jgi:hypothetical protein
MFDRLHDALLADMRLWDDAYLAAAMPAAVSRRDELARAGDHRGAARLADIVAALAQVRDERRALARAVSIVTTTDITDLVRLEDDDSDPDIV